MKKEKYPIFLEIYSRLKNKYFLTFLGFVVWISFFDRNDVITTWNYHKKLTSLRNEEAYYEKEIIKYKTDLNNLMTDVNNLEKYAREKYLMKKDDEDIFVIIDERKSTKD
jgi:cell division protein FtsB